MKKSCHRSCHASVIRFRLTLKVPSGANVHRFAPGSSLIHTSPTASKISDLSSRSEMGRKCGQQRKEQVREPGVCPASQMVKGGVNPNSHPGPGEETSLTGWGQAVPSASGKSPIGMVSTVKPEGVSSPSELLESLLLPSGLCCEKDFS